MNQQLSDEALDRIGALIVHADQLVDAIFFHVDPRGIRSETEMSRVIKAVRTDLSDHNIMALKLALDRENRLPK